MSSLTIIESKVPLFSRDIYIGGHELTKRISNALGIEYKDAVAYKLDPKDKKEEVLSACESALSNLIQELRLSFDYFASECNLEVEQLVLVGGSAKLTGLVELATTHLEVETIIWNPFNKLDVGEGCDNKNLKEDISKYAVAIGLALYDYD
jgi:type IV pilus assembly protein PilM